MDVCFAASFVLVASGFDYSDLELKFDDLRGKTERKSYNRQKYRNYFHL